MEAMKTLQAGMTLSLCYAVAILLACAALVTMGIATCGLIVLRGRKAS